jgi:enterochelin esterase family protein
MTNQKKIAAHVSLPIAGLLAVLLAAPARAEVRRESFASASLGREVSYVVDLPPSYATGNRKYPVLYALHGLFESPASWEGRGLAAILAGLRERGEVPEFLVVMVDGGNSFFVNGKEGRYEDLVVKDLLAHVESTYRVAPGRDGRALLGVSMGGYAALRIAFKYPGLFRAVATHSAMLLEKIPTADEGARRGQMAAFFAAFGNPIDPQLWAESDPLSLAERADAKATPELYFDCGSEDRYGLFAGARDLHRALEARGVPHTFGLFPGDHGYEYVRSVLDRSLKFTGHALASGAPLAAPRPGGDR